MLNSINTNQAAIVALQSFGKAQAELATTTRRMATGARVADSRDDGAAFAVSQGMLAEIAGLRATNEQFGNLKGLLEISLSGLRQVTNAMVDMKAILVRMADDVFSPQQGNMMAVQFEAVRSQIGEYITDATYGGKTLLSLVAANGGGDATAYRGTAGGVLTVAAVDGTTLQMPTVIPDAAGARRWLEEGGQFDTVFSAIGSAMNSFGNASRYLDRQLEYNSDKADALEEARGALVDANLAKEAARLQAGEVRQQLARQSLAITVEAPSSLLRLYRN